MPVLKVYKVGRWIQYIKSKKIVEKKKGTAG